MFRSRQAIITSSSSNYWGLFFNRRHFLFINQSGKKSQRQQQFGSNSSTCLLALKGGRQKLLAYQTNLSGYNALQHYNNTGIIRSCKMLELEQQQRRQQFVASSSSSGQQQEQQQQQNGHTLARTVFRLNYTDVLKLELCQGRTRNFFILERQIRYNGYNIKIHFVPEDAYPLVNAMDTLLNTLLAKHQQKWEIRSSNSSEQPGPVALESQRISTEFFDIQLELFRLGNNGAYVFEVNTLKTVQQEHREKKFRLPIRVLPWLRHTLAQMLAEHDDEGGSHQQLGPAPPLELPESILKARPVQTRRPQRHSNQRQQQKQQFANASHPKPSASELPSPPRFGQQQFHQSPSPLQHRSSSSSSSTLGTAPPPQPHNFQKKKPKQTAAAGQWNHRQQQTGAAVQNRANVPLAREWLRLDSIDTLQLRLRQGKTMKFFTLTKLSGSENRPVASSTDFPNLMLRFGYPLVNAMDTLLRTLAAKHQQQEIDDDDSLPVLLENQRISGSFFDIKLELVRLGGDNSNAYEFKIKSIKTVQEHKERELRLHVRALPWLRHTMDKMLAEHDGEDGGNQQQLGSAPPELPESILKARPVQTRRPQLRSNLQRQLQHQQFANTSHQKPSAAKLPSPRSRQSSSSTFGAPQPHNFQKKKPKQTALAGQWNHRQQTPISQQQISGTAAGQIRLNNNSRNTTRVNKQPPSPHPLPPPPQPRLSQIFHLQQPGPPAPPLELELLLPESVLKVARPAPAAIQTRRPQLHNNQRQQQKQQFASHQQPSAKLPSPPVSPRFGQQSHQSPRQRSSSSSSTLGTAPLPLPHNFQKEKPKQTAAGQWNHRQQQQPTKISQQHQTGAGQVKRMNGNNNKSSLPPPQPLPLSTNNRPAPRLSQIFRLQTVPADAADKSS